jgi:hypothetical protein
MTTNHTDLIRRLREMSRRGYWPLLGDEAADALEAMQAAHICLYCEALVTAINKMGVEIANLNAAVKCSAMRGTPCTKT